MEYNPYSNTIWNKHIPSVSHAHLSSQDHFDNAYAEGIRHFAITNYHPSVVYYPLDEHFDVPADVIGCPNTEHYGMTDTSLHMCSVGSMYASGDGVGAPWTKAFDDAISEMLYPDGGTLIICHPLWSGLHLNTILAMLDYAPLRLGIEIWNDGADDDDSVTNLWDQILTTGRCCFGFMAPDHEAKAGSWDGRNILVVDAANELSCAQAYRSGSLYTSIKGNLNELRFNNISATDSNIIVNTTGAAKIEFISDVRTVTVSADSAEYTVIGDEVFVRIKATKNDDAIYSQPIMYMTQEEALRKQKKNLHKRFLIL